MPDELFDYKKLRTVVPLSRTTIWRMVIAGQFPEPVAISKDRRAWRRSDVDAWIAARKTVAEGGQADFVPAAPQRESEARRQL